MSTLWRWLLSLFGIRPSPPPAPPDPVAMWRTSAEALYREELHRAIDDEGWRFFVQQAKAGWVIEDFRAWIRASPEWAAVHAIPDSERPPVVTLPVLHADERVFRLPDGTIWRYQGATAFALLKRYLDGDDCGALLDWLRSIGVNTVRVLCRCWWLELNPKTVPDYFPKLDAFLSSLEQRGLRCEVVALADCRTTDRDHVVPPEYTLTAGEMWTFLHDVAAVVRKHPAHFLEDGNEWDFNGWTPSQLPASLPGVLRSRGCGGMDEPPVRGGQYATFHSGRGAEFMRKMGKQAAEWSYGCGLQPEGGALGVPVVDDEPERMTATGDPLAFYEGHAVASLLCAGSTLHSDALKWCRIPEGRERECVEMAAQAWRDVPLGTVLGQYTRGGLSDSPLEHMDLPALAGALRTFAMIQGDRATAVVVRPGAAHVALGRNGWRVVKETNGRIVELAR